jgi:aspartyl aminopeptidase
MHAARDLCAFVDASPSPWHAAYTLADRLVAKGFRRLELDAPAWDLGPGSWYVHRNGTVVAWRLREGALRRFAVVGAHTDSPNLRLKPRAAYASEGCLQLGVEVYGGALWNSWLDRDLGLAGVVFTEDGKAHPLRVHRPVARVSQLAIHLDRGVNTDGLKLNPQLHLAPTWGLARAGVDPAEALFALLADAAGVDPKAVRAHDVSLYDLTPSTLGGYDESLIFAPRLDNLACSHAGLAAMEAAEVGRDDTCAVLACFDHEEVGSSSLDGADGTLLSVVLERIALERGLTRSAWHASIASSLMLSADMAHAAHPNYGDKHEPRHKPVLGGGPVLKTNYNLRYGTNAGTAAALRALADSVGVTLQDFVTRTDIGCGSTIGPICASRLGMPVVDLGDPMLSMHSARECAAAEDHPRLIALLNAHLTV